MVRLANGPGFQLDRLIGKSVAEIVGATESSADDVLEMLFLRVHGSAEWHRMFLEAGVGFWEVWDEPDAFCDYEELRLIDFADRWGLAGRTILAAECIGGTWDDSVLSRFMIVMDCGTLTLSSRDSANIESGAVLAFQPTAKIGK